MTNTTIQGICIIAMIAALPLISWGASSDLTAVTIGGSLLLALGMLTLTALRYVPTKEES